MSTKPQLFEWSVFALAAVLFCFLLAFRPIPSSDNANDTVRYVSKLHQYCGKEISEDLATNQKISYDFFYAVTSPSCWTGSDGIFLFEVAAFLPLMFLLFSSWRNGTLLWACSLMFSVYGLELMTNAMRQGLAMLLFFGALALVRKHLVRAILLGALAVAAHTSVLAFFPLLLWMSGVKLSRKFWIVSGVLSLLIVASGGMIYRAEIAELFSIMGDSQSFYRTIYAEELNTSFVIFMAFPLYFVYGLRRVFERKFITADERKSVVYSTVLLLLSFIILPAISYRFAIFSVPMQLFLVSMSERHSFKVGGFALVGFVVHLSIMLAISKDYVVLING